MIEIWWLKFASFFFLGGGVASEFEFASAALSLRPRCTQGRFCPKARLISRASEDGFLRGVHVCEGFLFLWEVFMELV